MSEHDWLFDKMMQCQARLDLGQEISLDQICRDDPHLQSHPELVAQLQEGLAKLGEVNRLVNQVATGPQVNSDADDPRGARLLGSNDQSHQDTQNLGDEMAPEDTSSGTAASSGASNRSSTTARLANGSTLGDYVILDVLGEGGMGLVYKAEHRRMKRTVALKMLSSKVTGSTAALQRFQREVETLARLKHPHIVTAHDAREDGGATYLVMELVDGSDLATLVNTSGALPVADAVDYILQAARGLEYAHGKGVLHRDIKPSNLFLDRDGTVKILDLGLASFDAAVDLQQHTELTNSAMILGTVDFMSPEQAFRPKQVDGRSDIYSLGSTLYYLLAGRPMYGGDTVLERLVANREQPIPSLRAVQPDVSEQLARIFRKSVAKKMEDRYQSMSEVVAALEALQRTDPLAAKVESHDHRVSAADYPRRSKCKLLALLGGGLLALILLAAVIIRLKTKDGTLVVAIDQPDATVEVLSEAGQVEISRSGEKGSITIGVDPGKHRLKVSKEGFEIFGEQFEITSGKQSSITATLIPLANKPWNTPDFQKWMKEVATLPAEEQVQVVAKKLQELNPGFDGKVGPGIENGVVTGLGFITDKVTDISPLRALVGLQMLYCNGSDEGKGKLSDLSPLKGSGLRELRCGYNPLLFDLSPLQATPLTMLDCYGTAVSELSPLKGLHLTKLVCWTTSVSDLSPLRGMPLTELWCGTTRVSDLSPLEKMPLTCLHCGDTPVSDLSPLRGMSLAKLHVERTQVSSLLPLKRMPLIDLFCQKTRVTDLSLLREMPLKDLKCDFNADRDTAILRTITTLETINEKPAAEFWKEVEASAKIAPAQTPWNTAEFQQWMKEVAAVPAERQVEAVAKKLKELNPGFDGNETHKIEAGVVTELDFIVDNVTNVAPVRALGGLNRLACHGSEPVKGKLSDLSPLLGMSLTELTCSGTQVTDLSPLKGMKLTKLYFDVSLLADLSPLLGMPLTELHCGGTHVANLSPLRGMPLRELWCGGSEVTDLAPLKGLPLATLSCDYTHVSDLLPLKGMALVVLACDHTDVSDLSPLNGMNLATILFTPNKITKGIDVIRQMKALKTIGLDWKDKSRFPPDEFWKKYDAGEFK